MDCKPSVYLRIHPSYFLVLNIIRLGVLRMLVVRGDIRGMLSSRDREERISSADWSTITVSDSFFEMPYGQGVNAMLRCRWSSCIRVLIAVCTSSSRGAQRRLVFAGRRCELAVIPSKEIIMSYKFEGLS